MRSWRSVAGDGDFVWACGFTQPYDESGAADWTCRGTVTFQVTTDGQLVHEFLVGDETAQNAFEAEMAAGDGMRHESAAGVSVEPGETETFEYTFGAEGQALLAGCHEPGHYSGGMVATITVAG